MRRISIVLALLVVVCGSGPLDLTALAAHADAGCEGACADCSSCLLCACCPTHTTTIPVTFSLSPLQHDAPLTLAQCQEPVVGPLPAEIFHPPKV